MILLLLYFLPMLILFVAVRIEYRRELDEVAAEVLVFIALVPFVNVLYILLAVLFYVVPLLTRIITGDRRP